MSRAPIQPERKYSTQLNVDMVLVPLELPGGGGVL